MNVWQLFAFVLAVMLPVLCFARLSRSRRPTVLILVLQVAFIPEIAFASYALFPTAIASVELLFPAAAILYGVAIASVLWSMFERRRVTQPVITLATLERQHLAAFVSRSAMIVLLSAVAFVFVPFLGVLDLVLNAAWTAIWIPRSRRSTEVRIEHEIAVAPHDLFEFIADTGNWPRYRDDFVAANPPGRLVAGSEVVTRQPVVWYNRPTENLARFVEVTSTVTSLVPDELIVFGVRGRPDESSRTELAPAPRGTRVTSVARGALTFPQAALGYKFELRQILAASDERLERTASRLKQLLERP